MYRISATLVFLMLFSPILASAKPAFLVDADWLAERIEDESLVVLEVRYHPHRYLTVGHIPGAVQVQRFKDLGDNTASPLMRFPTRDAFQASLRRWGVNNDSTVVIYDDSATALASRVYFLMDLYGFDLERVKILDGGTIEWTAFNELEKDAVTPQPGNVTLDAANPDLYAEWTAVYDDVVSRRDPSVVLLDARPHAMYTGEDGSHAIAAGHIPGAINIVSLDGVDGQSQKWRSDETLAAMYSSIPKDNSVYAYCHDGFRMSLAYMQLKHLGYENIRLYNGGWAHWGNTQTLPVVKGENPLDEAFDL